MKENKSHAISVYFRFLFTLKFLGGFKRIANPHFSSVSFTVFPLLNCDVSHEVRCHTEVCMMWAGEGNPMKTDADNFMGHSFLLHHWLVWQISFYFCTLAKAQLHKRERWPNCDACLLIFCMVFGRRSKREWRPPLPWRPLYPKKNTFKCKLKDVRQKGFPTFSQRCMYWVNWFYLCFVPLLAKVPLQSSKLVSVSVTRASWNHTTGEEHDPWSNRGLHTNKKYRIITSKTQHCKRQ